MSGPELRRARVSGGELAYLDVGEGPAVLLIHGFPTSSHLWRGFVPAIWQSGMRALVPDLLGYGSSDHPAGAPLHPRAQAGYLRELLDGLEVERVAVVGHDLGGAVAQLLALDHPSVEAVVLMDAAAFDVWPIEGVRMLQDATADQETPAFVSQVIDLALELGMGHPERLTDEVREAYRAPFAGQEGTAAFFRAVRAIDGLGLTGREEELGALEVPVLLLWGEDDPYLSIEVAERLADTIPTASLALLPGCSHFLPEDAPETAAPLVAEYLRARWLRSGHGHGHGHGHGGGGPVPVEIRGLDP